jgi:hypothetical protein
MAYSDIALLSSDGDFINRIRACVSTEGETDPVSWTRDNIWAMAASPGFGDEYASAIVNGIARPGNDQSVISDSELLSAVQAIRSDAVNRGDGT